jgi:mono/diheme cytochrome c family protein
MRLLLFVSAASLAMATAGCKSKTEEMPVDKPPVAAPTPAPEPTPPPPDPQLVERGAYLAGISGCVGCHTAFGPQGPAMDKAFAGGLQITEEFGTWRSPNITQDKKTGLGDWTDEQIIAAVREGKRPDGVQLAPIMPYPFFSVLSDDDAKALVAFLRTIKPIENAVEGNSDLKLPKIPGPPPTGVAPPKDDPVKYGEYLATVMHCGACHTPMTEAGPDMTKMLAGGNPFPMPPEMSFLGTGTLYTANLTPDKKTGLGKWTEEQVIAGFTELKRPDGRQLAGPMIMYRQAWSSMPDEDKKAVAAYLKQIPAVVNKVPAGTFKPGAPPGAEGTPDKAAGKAKP